MVRRDSITLEYDARDTVLELNSSGSGLNFDVKVACSVRDASIAGVLTVDVVSEPSVIVGFVGAQVALDPSFSAQREACFKSLTARFKEQFTQPDRVPGPVGPINYGTIAQLPAYARLEQYEQAEYALRLSAMARAVEPKRVGDDFEKSLIEQFPILAVPELIVNLVSREQGSLPGRHRGITKEFISSPTRIRAVERVGRRYERSLATRRTHARTALRSPSSRRYATTPNAMIAQPAAGTARAQASSL